MNAMKAVTRGVLLGGVVVLLLAVTRRPAQQAVTLRVAADSRVELDEIGNVFAVPAGKGAAPTTQGALRRTIASLDLKDVRLREALWRLRDALDCDLFIDWGRIEAAGVDRDTPVSLRATAVSGESAFRLLLEDRALRSAKLEVAERGNGLVVVTTADDYAQLVTTRLYDITDLIALIHKSDARLDSAFPPPPSMPGLFNHGPATATRSEIVDALVKFIEDSVHTEDWKDNGGSVGSMREFAGHLIISATPPIHADVERELANLRAHFSK